jgi:hypothetical protein
MPNFKNPGFIDFDSIDLSQKTKETLKDQSLTHITMFGKETDIERCLDNNCSNYEFMTTILKIPLNVNLSNCSTLVEKIKNHSHSDAELYTVIEHKNTNNVTIYGVGTVLFNTSGFNFSKENPSPVEKLFKKKINKIFKLQGIAGAECRYQNKNILTDSLSYLAWSHKLQNWKNKASDNPTLSSELEEAINLIKGKFKSHANSVLRNQYKEEV